MTMVVAPIIQL